MSLRKIHKRTERGDSPIIKAVNAITGLFAKITSGTSRTSHAPQHPSSQHLSPEHHAMHRFERNLIQPKKFGKENKVRKDLLLIGIIAAVAIAAIVIEFTAFGAKAPAPQTQPVINLTNITNTTNQTEIPIIVDEKPDLYIGSLKVSKTEALTDEPLVITAVYGNQGKTNATGAQLTFYLGTAVLSNHNLGDLEPDSEEELAINWTPKEENIGDRIIKVEIDPSNKVGEEIETNNEESKTITVSQNILKDVSANFKFKTVVGVGGRWYSDKYGLPPKGGPTFTYFQIYPDGTGAYLLDVGIAGFKAQKSGTDVYKIEVPDASSDEWNGGNCMREKQEEGYDCIWTGPMISLNLGFSKGDIVATDASSIKSRATSSNSKISKIELAGMSFAKWPEELNTFRISGVDAPNTLVPQEFYEIVGSKIYVYPMRWNPEAHEAQVTTWLSFRITTK
jgi:hypothetical protein